MAPQSPSWLEVVPGRGGLITQWQVQGQDLLYLDRERFADLSLSVRGGIPILFPICGNMPDNVYEVEGRSFQLKQHGFARDLPWQVQEQTPTQLRLTLESQPATLVQYPFPFQLQVTYTLAGNALILNQRVLNRGAQPMPFCWGLHPYFAVAEKTGLRVEIPATEFQDQITQQRHAFEGHLDWEAEELDLAFAPLTASTAALVDPHRNLKITLSFDADFSTLVVWAVKGKPYCCLEPWSAPRNALNTRQQLLTVPPWGAWEAGITLTVSAL
ncbi:aldose epimerase [Synechococcales cyanobacterium C]|uniref:Aldose epimerase n=1 Tax=Petrachloros mirabilis ULC683 TaxID=2781853 RepID=A0A8K2AC41_9CYAN|nr:aldose epimerase [Petrachloros mirabilis]NCJ05625.1 aldose epimerase [Petrachloros mirabilis ULC683]